MSMGNAILNFFRLDEEDVDNYEEEIYEEEYEPPKQASKRSSRSFSRSRSDYEDDTKQKSGFLSSKPKVVPMNRGAAMEVRVVKPNSFEDSQEICNLLLSNRPVIVNLEGFDPDDAQRIMDFISGCIYAINGKYHQISKYIFIFSPENVDISGDSLSIDGNVSAMPVINRGF